MTGDKGREGVSFMDPGSPSSLQWGACLQGPVSCSMGMAIIPELAIPYLER